MKCQLLIGSYIKRKDFVFVFVFACQALFVDTKNPHAAPNNLIGLEFRVYVSHMSGTFPVNILLLLSCRIVDELSV